MARGLRESGDSSSFPPESRISRAVNGGHDSQELPNTPHLSIKKDDAAESPLRPDVMSWPVRILIPLPRRRAAVISLVVPQRDITCRSCGRRVGAR